MHTIACFTVFTHAFCHMHVENLLKRSASQRYKVCLFAILSKAHVVDKEYPQGIYSPIFVVEEFSGIFAHSSIFFIKSSMSS